MVGRNVEISRREMLAALVAASIVFPSLSAAADPLPSWNVGTLKGAVVEFVTEVTTPGSAELVPARSGSPSLINGTLWVEKPITQRVKALAPVPQASESFVDSIVGVRTGSGLSENWLALVSAAVDGFGIGSDYSWNVEGYVGYRMSATGCTVFGIPTVLSLGYLALHQKHQGRIQVARYTRSSV
jgi:hypothetical protein